MKIDEFIKEVQEYDGLDADKDENGNIDIYYGDDVIIVIPSKSKTWFDIQYAVDSFDEYLFPSAKRFLSEKINTLFKTPIKDRFPEKKYRLRWITDDDGTPNYVHKLCGSWNWNTTKRDTKTFTESELEHLKKENPKLAPAIDAMKEPVEE